MIINLIVSLSNLRTFLGLGMIIGILAFYCLIFYFGFSLVTKMKTNLNEIMKISDN